MIDANLGSHLHGGHSYQKAKDFIEIGDINEVFVKGMKSAVRMYELAAISRPNTRPAG